MGAGPRKVMCLFHDIMGAGPNKEARAVLKLYDQALQINVSCMQLMWVPCVFEGVRCADTFSGLYTIERMMGMVRGGPSFET